MDATSARLLYSRSRQDDLYLSALRNRAPGREGAAVRLIDTIFDHLPAVYGAPGSRMSRVITDGAGSDPLSRNWIAKEFYEKHFCPITIRRDFAGTEVSIKNFVDELARFDYGDERNELFFLQGPVGSGKTALINYIITNHGKRLFTKSGVWFLRLNVDIVRN